MTRHPSQHWWRRALLGALACVVLLFALIGVLSILGDRQETRVRAFGDPEGAPAVGDPEFARTISLLAGTELKPGNHAAVYINGDQTYSAMWRAMRQARQSLTVQLYYMEPGRLTDSLVAVLQERSRAGVATYLLRDAFGSQLSDSASAALRAAGVHLSVFRPVRWWTLHKAQNRSHVRAVVIDGREGFTGGFGIDDRWSGSGRDAGQWRDTNVRFDGPSAQQLQAAFVLAWSEATGELLTGERFFPSRSSDAPSTASADSVGMSSSGGLIAGLMHSNATFGPTEAARLFALAAAGARRTLYITNAYFVPDDVMAQQLAAASARGVDVRLLLPGERTDVPVTRYAARSWYGSLLRAGIRIYEYQPTMLHAKTFVVDGQFSSIGTMNLDYRSLALNDEANLLVLDAGFGARMDTMFMTDLRYSRAIDPAVFARRGAWQKLRERFARAIGRVL
jgi:cardiolipin synthase